VIFPFRLLLPLLHSPSDWTLVKFCTLTSLFGGVLPSSFSGDPSVPRRSPGSVAVMTDLFLKADAGSSLFDRLFVSIIPIFSFAVGGLSFYAETSTCLLVAALTRLWPLSRLSYPLPSVTPAVTLSTLLRCWRSRSIFSFCCFAAL